MQAPALNHPGRTLPAPRKAPTAVASYEPTAQLPHSSRFAHLHRHDNYRKRGSHLELGRAFIAKKELLEEICDQIREAVAVGEALVSSSEVSSGD